MLQHLTPFHKLARAPEKAYYVVYEEAVSVMDPSSRLSVVWTISILSASYWGIPAGMDHKSQDSGQDMKVASRS